MYDILQTKNTRYNLWNSPRCADIFRNIKLLKDAYVAVIGPFTWPNVAMFFPDALCKISKRKQEQTASPAVRLRCPVTTAITNGNGPEHKGAQ